MKKTYSFILSIIITFGFAQIPSGYYNSATGSGYALKTQLKNIIDNNTNSSGNASYSDLWDLYTTTAFRDNYYENNGSLLDIYSEKPQGTDSYEYTSTSQQCGNYNGEGDCYNREHIIPQSVFNSSYPMYSDAHFVVPTDGSINGARGNLPFGVVGTANYTSTNLSKRGNNTNTGYAAGYSDVVFEPIDEFKGDVARAMLYFATRYENQIPSWSFDMFNGTTNQVFTNTFLNIVIKWHLLDSVSAYEIAKNNTIYTFQGNRNPFIDTPNYVCQIWPAQCQALGVEAINVDFETKVYPNPSLEKIVNIASNFELNEITIINLNGQELMQKKANSNQLTVDLNHLSEGIYILKMVSEDRIDYKKIVLD